jgi:hypothetical protein
LIECEALGLESGGNLALRLGWWLRDGRGGCGKLLRATLSRLIGASRRWGSLGDLLGGLLLAIG